MSFPLTKSQWLNTKCQAVLFSFQKETMIKTSADIWCLVASLSNGKDICLSPIKWKGHREDIGDFFFRFFKLKTSKLTSEISWPLAAPGDLSSTENSLYLSPLQPRTAIPPPPPQLAGEARGEPLREAKVERRCCSGFRLLFCYEVRVLRVL